MRGILCWLARLYIHDIPGFGYIIPPRVVEMLRLTSHDSRDFDNIMVSAGSTPAPRTMWTLPASNIDPTCQERIAALQSNASQLEEKLLRLKRLGEGKTEDTDVYLSANDDVLSFSREASTLADAVTTQMSRGPAAVASTTVFVKLLESRLAHPASGQAGLSLEEKMADQSDGSCKPTFELAPTGGILRDREAHLRRYVPRALHRYANALGYPSKAIGSAIETFGAMTSAEQCTEMTRLDTEHRAAMSMLEERMPEALRLIRHGVASKDDKEKLTKSLDNLATSFERHTANLRADDAHTKIAEANLLWTAYEPIFDFKNVLASFQSANDRNAHSGNGTSGGPSKLKQRVAGALSAVEELLATALLVGIPPPTSRELPDSLGDTIWPLQGYPSVPGSNDPSTGKSFADRLPRLRAVSEVLRHETPFNEAEGVSANSFVKALGTALPFHLRQLQDAVSRSFFAACSQRPDVVLPTDEHLRQACQSFTPTTPSA